MLDFGFYNMDCMDGMKEFPDGYFELAIVDPPYGDASKNKGGGTGIDSVRDSTGTKIHKLGNRRELVTELQGLAEHGPRNSQKNYIVGCSAGKRIF